MIIYIPFDVDVFFDFIVIGTVIAIASFVVDYGSGGGYFRIGGFSP